MDRETTCIFIETVRGNEIDLCYEEGHRLKIIEIKKGSTINSEPQS